ncbi:uncharacterized protein BCR38DRAFT_336650 [Pseudomassariella vexata]|uniref:DUF7728 domain-containing protein n=1 Tax=Pseudomassariella vexata TaxID=1141098 RepID=A0A1Y2E8M0_9PEZI|nr:uncharacterized protein BCR38DRAFT_336650 [Pseudomassariella vexata]ORY67664.1 hypothetical protein BCR38DRAFT_336650 [Pseudomassariella vexata]
MQLTSLLTAAGLAVSATHAFLLPFPESTTESDVVNTLPVPFNTDVALASTVGARSLDLNCPGCPVHVHHKGKDGKAKMKTDIPSHLQLDFKIDHAYSGDRLMLNGFELYPHADPTSSTLGAKLLPDMPHRQYGKHRPGHKQHEAEPDSLGFALHVQPVAKSTENLELILVNLQIIEVGNVFIDGIPNVELKLIKSPEGGLMIGGIQTTASETTQKTPMDKQEECTTLLCKWRAMFMQQIAHLRANKHCGGRPGQQVGHVEGHRRPGHHNMHQGHRASWAQLFKNIGAHILLPIAVGIVAGVTASILGMMVGTAIIFLWRTFVRPAGHRRHHRHAHSIHKAAIKENAADDEKSGLMAHQDVDDVEAPPAYVEEGLVADKKPENDA